MKAYSLLLAAFVSASTFPVIAQAGSVERACLRSGRPAANPSLCACIDASARSTLSISEQQRAARLILSPELSERTLRSKRSGDRAFYKNYSNFAKTAESRCG